MALKRLFISFITYVIWVFCYACGSHNPQRSCLSCIFTMAKSSRHEEKGNHFYSSCRLAGFRRLWGFRGAAYQWWWWKESLSNGLFLKFHFCRTLALICWYIRGVVSILERVDQSTKRKSYCGGSWYSSNAFSISCMRSSNSTKTSAFMVVSLMSLYSDSY